MGFRVADAPANEQIKRWQLLFPDGSQHWWRELKTNEGGWFTPDQSINASKAEKQVSLKTFHAGGHSRFWRQSNNQNSSMANEREIATPDPGTREPKLRWMRIYRGLLPTMSIRIPATLKPTLAIDVADQHRTFPGTAIPGGPVFNEIRIELEASQPEWI